MTGSHHPICRRQAAAKADKLATNPADWQRIFDAEFARLAELADARAQDRRQGVRRGKKHWRYLGDTTTYSRPVCELGHLARQNGDRMG
jgi:hypothetical protein